MQIQAVLMRSNRDPETVASVSCDVLTVNGEDFDLAEIQNGDVATPVGDHPFVGSLTRVDGEVSLSMYWVYSPLTASPNQGAVNPILFVESGQVPDPVVRI